MNIFPEWLPLADNIKNTAYTCAVLAFIMLIVAIRAAGKRDKTTKYTFIFFAVVLGAVSAVCFVWNSLQ